MVSEEFLELVEELIKGAYEQSEPFPHKIVCATCGLRKEPQELVRQWDGKIVCARCKDKMPERYKRESRRRVRMRLRIPFLRRGR